MKITLVIPISTKAVNIIPSLGLGYLSTALRNNGYEVKYLDCVKEKIDFNAWGNKDFICSLGDVIGLQYFTCDYSSVVRMAEIAKDKNPKVKIIVGGPHVTGYPKCVLNKNIDFGFIGEAIIGLPQLLNEKFNNLSNIPGLVYKLESGRFQANPKKLIDNPDNFGFPAWDLIRPDQYPLLPHGTFSKGKKTCPMMTTFGCPYRCQYCAGKLSTGAKLRKRSVPHILNEIKLLHEQYGIDEIHFEDDNFTLNKQFAKDVCNKIITYKRETAIKDLWFACPNGVRLDSLDEELLRLMEKAGFYSFSIGVESGSNRILKKMGRNITKETIEEKVKLIARATNIKMTGFCMMGYPAETVEEMKETAAFTRRLPIHRVGYFNFHPLPGTPIFDELVSSGKIDENNIVWDQYQDNTISYCPDGTTLKQLKKIMEGSFRKFYLRPKIIYGCLKEINNLSQAKMLARRAFESFT